MQPSFLNPLAEIDIHVEHLPHWQQQKVACFVTWRLADSVPQTLLREWKLQRQEWIRMNPQPWTDHQAETYHHLFSHQVDRWLDQGLGSRALAQEAHANIVRDTLEHLHDRDYVLHAYVVMPTHVHVVFTTHSGLRMAKIIQAWKSVSSRRMCRKSNLKAPVWQARYWDRLIRSAVHFEACVKYVRDNPVKAGLREGEYLVRVFNV